MKYLKLIKLKNGLDCTLKSPSITDAPEVLRNFTATHNESEFLASYGDESILTIESEENYIERTNNSSDSVSICAFINGKIVGMTGVAPVGNTSKLRHRATFGVSIEKEYCGIGLGRALTESAIEFAKSQGYYQIELEVISDNYIALNLYKSLGFVEFGLNPYGMKKRNGQWKEVISMRLEL